MRAVSIRIGIRLPSARSTWHTVSPSTIGIEHVEHDDVGLGVGGGVERLGAVADGGDAVALELEGAGERLAHGPIVLGDQQAVPCGRGLSQHIHSLPPAGKSEVGFRIRPAA